MGGPIHDTPDDEGVLNLYNQNIWFLLVLMSMYVHSQCYYIQAYPTSALSLLLWWRNLSQRTLVSQSYHQNALWCTDREAIIKAQLLRTYICMVWLRVCMSLYLLYGLQAAMNLISSWMASPFSLLSHMISLISSMASEVLASSKNKTVSKPIFWFSAATTWTWLTKWAISFSVTPPWI